MKWRLKCRKLSTKKTWAYFTTKIILSDAAISGLSSQVNGHRVRMWASNSPPAMIEAQRTSLRPMSFVFSLNINSPGSYIATCSVPTHVGGLSHANFERKVPYWYAILTRLRQMPPHFHFKFRTVHLELKAPKEIESKQRSYHLATSFPWNYTNRFILIETHNLRDAVYVPPLPGTMPAHRLQSQRPCWQMCGPNLNTDMI